MSSEKSRADRGAAILPAWLCSGGFGAFLGLALLKFGNPPIMVKFVERPTNVAEWIISAWPLDVGYWLLALVVYSLLAIVGLVWLLPRQVPKWLLCLPLAWLGWRWIAAGPLEAGYWLLGIVAVAVLLGARLPAWSPKWSLALPLAWLGWQFVSATHSVEAELTRQTLKHFVACVVCFYLGCFCLSRDRCAGAFWIPMLCAFGLVIAVGFDQRFGGLEETRKYFYAYIYPNLPNVPPEYLKKISSDRIFSTLFYPNALAGAILLLLPVSLGLIWRLGGRLTVASRLLLAGLFGAGSLACLYWSGSKGGWLLVLMVALVALLHLPLSNRIKAVVVAIVFLCGVTGFFVKYAGFFERGATSVVARFDYWSAALQTVAANPVFGTGPGTFGVAYLAIKKPESEMSRLTHNDYLQQASDSGVLGCASYLAMMLSIILRGYTKPKDPEGVVKFLVWLGFLGWALQGTMEFGLYIPALAWPAFGLAGWLLRAQPGRVPAR